MLFFYNYYEEIDLSSLKYLSEEIVPPVHDVDERRLDIVAEVKWNSTNTIIVHIEPQNYVKMNFNEGMFHKFYLHHLPALNNNFSFDHMIVILK